MTALPKLLIRRVLACVTFAALLAGCAQPREQGRVDVVPELAIATDATFAPFHYVDDEGRVTGFDVELAREMGRRAGFEPRVVVVPYDQLFASLVAGNYQVVAASTGVTEQRQRQYLFTSAYFDTCQAALVRAGEQEPQSLRELAGRRVGAAGSGTSVLALDRLPGVIPILLSEREATEETILEDGSVPVLESGGIDALIVDEFDAVKAARSSDGGLRVLSEPVALERYGFVLASNNVALQRSLNEALRSMREDGSLQTLLRDFGLGRGTDWPVDLR